MSGERPAPSPEATAAVSRSLHESERLAEVLPAIQAVAANHDGVYLVGGAVRDVLLGEASLDLDVMVEGDAVALARELAAALGGQWRPHERFQTAVVEGTGASGHAVRVDLASARTESYGAPGALPDVQRATLRDDLARRDFSINAMATSLRPDDLGATYDLFGGYRDLESGTVRVLHDLSFIEDPTRLLRAVRYETRFGFAMDVHTESLVRACSDGPLLTTLPSTRVRDELLDLLAEERVTGALLRMAQLGVDRALHRRANAQAAAAYVEAADAAMQGPLEEASVPLVRMACLSAGMAEREVSEWLDRIQFAARDRDVVATAVALGPVVAERLSQAAAPAPSEVYELVEGQPLEALVMAIVLARDTSLVAERLHGYLDRTRGVRLDITGDDLRRAGVPESPEIGAALKQTLALKLDGFVSGRDEELATALRILGR